MSNIKAIIEEWSVKDLEDNSSINVLAESGTELGNDSKPGIQILYMGNYITFEPNSVAQWAYKAGKAHVTEYLLEDRSWTVHTDQFVKVYLIVGSPLKARIEMKTRSSSVVMKEYELPFAV